jgi:hypothetical protein
MRSQGGDDSDLNLITLCHYCHANEHRLTRETGCPHNAMSERGAKPVRKNLVRVTNVRMLVQNVVFLFSMVRTIWLIATVLCDSELPCSCPTLLVGLSFAPAWLPSRNCLARGSGIDNDRPFPGGLSSRGSVLAQAAGLLPGTRDTARRLTDAARLSLVFWSRFFDWNESLAIVTAETFFRWHRKGFQFYWRLEISWQSTGAAEGNPPAHRSYGEGEHHLGRRAHRR